MKIRERQQKLGKHDGEESSLVTEKNGKCLHGEKNRAHQTFLSRNNLLKISKYFDLKNVVSIYLLIIPLKTPKQLATEESGRFLT